jgi:hypothetical protein
MTYSSVLWGNEISAVRLFYRDFTEIEARANVIGQVWIKLLEENSAQKNMRELRQIEIEIRMISNLVNFWTMRGGGPIIGVDDAGKLARDAVVEKAKQFDFSQVPRSMLYRKIYWYPMFWLIPSALGAFLCVTAVFIPSGWKLFDLVFGGFTLSALVFLVAIVLKSWLYDRRIDRWIVKPAADRWKRELNNAKKKDPPLLKGSEFSAT